MGKWKSFSKKKKAWIIVACVVLAAALGVGIYFLVRPEPGTPVEVVTAENEKLVQTINPTATVESSDTDNFTLTAGTVPLNVNVQPGDRVKAGDVLATFDLTDLQQQVNEKQSAYDKAVSAYNAAVASNQSAKQQLTQINADIAAQEQEIEALKAKGIAPAEDLEQMRQDIAYIQQLVQNMTPEQLQELLEMFQAAGGTDSTFNSLISGSMQNLTNLVEAQSRLIKLQAQKVLLQAQSAISVSDIYQIAVDAAKSALDSARAQLNELSAGWVAQKEGLVTAVNIEEGVPFGGAQQEQNVDLSSILSSLTSGAQMDSSSIMQMITQMMNASSVGMSVSYDDGIQAVFSVGKYDVLDLHVGQEVKISSVTGDFNGKIVYISPTASSSGGLNISSLTGGSSSSANVTVKASIENPDESIIIGFDVDVEIATNEVQDAVAIPMEALSFDGSENYVYVLNADNTVTKRTVTTGIASDTMYQVLSGVEAGETVVRNPSSDLEDGAKVEPTRSTTSADGDTTNN